MATGSTLILAPEDPQRRVEIQSTEGKLLLYDGRNIAQNGWFVVRSKIPANKTGKVVEWHLTASTIKNWIRKPVIEFSQVGYHPAQEKIAVIELDKHDTPLQTASLYRVSPEGTSEKVFTAPIKKWGPLFRYNYVTFDFSSVRQSGIYFIKYGHQRSNVFPIDAHVYDNVWHQTLDVWFPVQMDHIYVRDAYKVWHGIPFLDDARQAPPNNIHFDNHGMGPSTDTKYKPGQHIPGLNVGGWFDAGDYDIEEPSQCEAISSFAATWEAFKPKLDETYINEKQRYVDIHDPDGKPDILEQIVHGVLQQLAQQKAFGRAIRAISENHLYEYDQLGDAAEVTDGKIYDPRLKLYQVKGDSSGTPDDRWAFTNDMPWINYRSIAALASASRALSGFNDSLATVCLQVAEQSWATQQKDTVGTGNRRFRFFERDAEIPADLQLMISTKKTLYANRFEKLIWSALHRSVDRNIKLAVLAIPYFGNDYKEKLEPFVKQLKEHDDSLLKRNPYGVPITTGGWGSDGGVVSWAITNYYVHKAFPEIVGPQYAIRGIDYLFGCHPYSNTSFVSSVGVHSKERFYSSNRADFSFIAGGVVPGILILNPDFPENMDAWPFLWGENESVIGICADYVFLSNAVNDLLHEDTDKRKNLK
ncbi:MAG: glycoside hydrolase family 9 protein [Chitinophagaceae bacterium]